jgi:hypothetical protein
MATTPNVIRVPKPSGKSFNPNRPLEGNLLLRNQVEHFRKRELELPAEQHTGIDLKKVKTEGQAAEYIRKLMTVLHPQAQHGGKTK